MPSSPADPDRGPRRLRPRAPAWITDAGGDVVFLDLPGLDADAVVTEIELALSSRPESSVVCVFTDDSAAESVAVAWCSARDVELVTSIRHEVDGRTLVLRTNLRPVRPMSERSQAPS